MYHIKNIKRYAAVTAAGLTALAFAAGNTVNAFALSSSSRLQDAGKAYYASDYRYLDDEDSVFQSLTYAEAVELFQQEGNYLILLGGSWCPNTTAVIDYVNAAAHRAGVETVYNLDFRLDGQNADTHIREPNGSSAHGAEYNYLYGELVTRYLTNLDDWVEYSSDRATALGYTDADGQEATVAKVQVPFLFIYNRDNTVHNYEDESDGRTVKTKPAEIDQNGNVKKYPIVYGFERMVYRKSGTAELYTDASTQDESTRVSDYAEQLDGAIFSHLGEGKLQLSYFNRGDYIRQSYNRAAGEEIFGADDKIAVVPVTYRQLVWLLGQEGNYLLLFGGAEREETRGMIAQINAYALQYGVTVYTFDDLLDGAYARTYWNYTKVLDISDSASAFYGLYEARLALLKDDGAFVAYDRSGGTPVYASAESGEAVAGVFESYAQRTGTAVQNSSVGWVPRVVALTIGVAATAGILVYVAVRDRKGKQPENNDNLSKGEQI